jgi:hypothetical protein
MVSRAVPCGSPDADGRVLVCMKAQLLAAWREAAADTDPGVVPPDAVDTLVATPRSVQAGLRALSGSRFFADVALRDGRGFEARAWLSPRRAGARGRAGADRRVDRPGHAGGGGTLARVGRRLRGAVRHPRARCAGSGHARLPARDQESGLRPSTPRTGSRRAGRRAARGVARGPRSGVDEPGRLRGGGRGADRRHQRPRRDGACRTRAHRLKPPFSCSNPRRPSPSPPQQTS